MLAFGWASADAATIQARVSAEGKALDNAVIYAVPKGGTPRATTSSTRKVMQQESQRFQPEVLPVQVGTTVDFPNHDPFRHHVYSFSPAKVFELKLYGTGEVRSVTFDKEGIVALGCNIHDNMLAYIYVVATPYFATSQGGAGTIDVPAGDYTVKVWHPNQGSGNSRDYQVSVAANGTAQIDMAVDLKRDRQQRPRGAFDEHAY